MNYLLGGKNPLKSGLQFRSVRHNTFLGQKTPLSGAEDGSERAWDSKKNCFFSRYPGHGSHKYNNPLSGKRLKSVPKAQELSCLVSPITVLQYELHITVLCAAYSSSYGLS